MKLLIVDGSNIVIRSALGDKIAPVDAVATASNIIERCARQFGAQYLVVTLDCPGCPSWRKIEYPDYKAHRTSDTSPWINEAHAYWSRKGWWVEAVNGFEADDVMATIACRTVMRGEVMVLSGDSDLLPLISEGIQIIRPMDGGRFEVQTNEHVKTRYGIPDTSMLVDLKAMTGESGDNVPGVPGIGKVRAAALLVRFQTLNGIFEAGMANADKYAAKVYDAKLVVQLAHKLITLRRDAPVTPIKPSGCRFIS